MMNVRDAALRRRSIRAYKPQSVPDIVIEDILKSALWAPSSGNIQPWHITIASGEKKDSLSRELLQASQEYPKGERQLSKPLLSAEYDERRRAAARKVYDSQGIAREDRQGRLIWSQEMLRFFGAPVVLFLHLPESLSPYHLLDVGILAGNIMLLATEKGLGTCCMAKPTVHPGVLKAQLRIPQDHIVTLAIAMGHPDETSLVNMFERERAVLSDVVTFVRPDPRKLS